MCFEGKKFQGINYNDCDMSSNFMVRDFGKKMLDSVPNNSVLLVKGDLGIPAMLVFSIINKLYNFSLSP